MSAAMVLLGLLALVCQGLAFEGELLRPPEGAEAWVRLKDAAKQVQETAPDALRRRGVAVLRQGLADDDVVGKEFLRGELLRDDMDAAMARLLRPESRLFARLGFGWAWCGDFRTRQSSPRGLGEEVPPVSPPPGPGGVSMLWLQLFRQTPWLGRVLKVALTGRVPVQPLAVRLQQEGSGEAGLWWWHSDVGDGDVIVLDSLLTWDSPVTLSGERALYESGKAATSLCEALRACAPPDRAFEVCQALPAEVLHPDPYPALGEQYKVNALPSALIRREESVESDVIGELRPGSIVSILSRGLESPGRVEVVAEQALRMPGYISDEGGPSSPRLSGGLKGWISSESYNGSRLLEPREPSEVPPGTARQLAELSGALRGICAWANVTLTAAAGPAWRTEQICRRHESTLEQLLRKSQHLSVEAVCVALESWETHQVVALAVTAVALLLGTLILAALSAATRPYYDM